MNIPYSTFLPDVSVDLPGCPQLFIQHHAIRVLADFCTQTRVLTEKLQALDVVAGQGEYTIAPSEATNQIVRIERVWVNGDLLAPVGVDELDAEIAEWRTATGLPRLFTSEAGSSTLTLVPVPDVGSVGGLVIEVSVAVDPAASPAPETFDARLYRKYGDGLACGIKTRLMLIPNKEWSNPEMAMVNAQGYAATIAQARGDVDNRQSRTRLRTRTYYR